MTAPAHTPDLIQKAFEALSGTTRARPLKSRDLQRVLGISDADGHPQTRQIVFEVMEQRNLPLGATNDGYYVIQSEDELKEYLRALDNRILGTLNRKVLVNKVFLQSRGLPAEAVLLDGTPDDSDEAEA
jgi:hypothetical protein